jgi:hypothetical protein
MEHTANVLSLKRVPRVRIPPSPQNQSGMLLYVAIQI